MATRKTCVRCEQIKPVSEFHRNKVISDGLAVYCKPCVSAIKRFHYYGVSAEWYAARLLAQDGACAVCGVRDQSRLPFAVDHDHRCCKGRRSCGACVRGLICDLCNRGIGFLGDSKDRLIAAASYLASFEA